MIVVSACMAGLAVRYDGNSSLIEGIARLVREGKAVLICPEQLGGFPTPRPPAEIQNGDGYDVLDGKAKVIDQQGEDVTEEFIRGARQALAVAQAAGATKAVLKENSPSCGSHFIYSGKFNGEKVKGVGVTTALFERNGIEVLSEDGFEGFLHKYERQSVEI